MRSNPQGKSREPQVELKAPAAASAAATGNRRAPGSAWGSARRDWSAPLVGVLLLLYCSCGLRADTFEWETNRNRVSVDMKSGDLFKVLGRIASLTGWQVYVEPNLKHEVSAKFKDLSPGEALHLLLGDLNFALVPESSAPSRLLVFRTSAQSATRLVPAARLGASPGKVIPNELLVRLKRGGKMEDLAKSLGAKITGRIASLNAYRLQFQDADAAATAREQLAGNSEVSSVDSNYSIESPPAPLALGAPAALGPPQLQLNPPPETGRVIVGLVDTAVQPLGNGLDSFLLKAVSVAGDASPDPNTPTHGTCMAETILSSLQTETKGSTSVQILPVDVYGANATTSTFDVASGIAQAVDGGATVVNLSLGSPGDSTFLHTVIQDASAKGVVFVGAAGNQPVTTPYYPAAYPEVDAVTAIDQGQLASYANRGSWISYGAPGNSVIIFNGQPWSVVGTSSSAADVSGAISGYMDANHTSADNAQSFVRNHFGISIHNYPGQ